MNLKSILALCTLTSLLIASTNSFAEECTQSEPKTITYYTQTTRSDAKKFPFYKASPKSEGKLIFFGQAFHDPEAKAIADGVMERQRSKTPRFDIPIQYMYSFALVPTIQDGKIMISGVLTTYDKDKKFVTNIPIERLLDKDEVTTFNIEAGGYKWEVNMKFTY